MKTKEKKQKVLLYTPMELSPKNQNVWKGNGWQESPSLKELLKDMKLVHENTFDEYLSILMQMGHKECWIIQEIVQQLLELNKKSGQLVMSCLRSLNWSSIYKEEEEEGLHLKEWNFSCGDPNCAKCSSHNEGETKN